MADLHFYDAEDRPWPNQRLSSASILGHVTARSIKIWVRARDPGTYYLLVDRRALAGGPQPDSFDGTNVLDAVGQPIAERAFRLALGFETDNTAVVEVDGLTPDTQYRYALV